MLYLSYNGLTEPLGRRQVLPYLVTLSGLGWRFTVVSFEKPETADTQAVELVTRVVARAGIDWRPLRYHGRPPLAAKALDMAQGILRGALARPSAQLIHARSTLPAAMAAILGRGLGVPWVFDVRGLLAEEYVDAAHWSRGGVLHRLTGGVEAALLRRAGGLVFLTERTRRALREAGAFCSSTPVATVPCCVELGHFRPQPEARAAVRAELGIGDEPVLVYSGSLGSWYRLEEMLAFYSEARNWIPRLRLLVLSPQAALAERALQGSCLRASVQTRSLRPEDVPAYLAAADAGICFLSDASSKAASSPTKYGEYLASGLPVVTNSWTGDAALLAGEPAWILVDNFGESNYRRAAQQLEGLLRTAERSRASARALAEREFSLEMAVARYDELYRAVLRTRR